MATTAQTLKPGSRVLVPWGVDEPREAIVVEVWGNPRAPSHIRVQLVAKLDEDEAPVLLLNPRNVIRT